MRISTQAFHASSLAAMLKQQAELAKTQNQVSTGKRVNSPADDPIAAAHILELERAQSASEQYAKNSTLASSRLTLEEQALADSGTLLQQVRDLVVQASNTATLSDSDRQSIGNQISALSDELRSIANRKDANGEYLFSGYSTLTQPFAKTGSTTTAYSGDQGSRVVQISASQRVADGHSGFDVFMDVPAGNGTFVTSAAGGNTGTGIIDTGTVTNAAAWVPDDYTLTFTSGTDWEVLDSTSTVVASGTYTSGGSIAFNGIQVAVSGSPAAGDSFGIAASGAQDMFGMLDSLAAALAQPAADSASVAQLSTLLAGGLQQIDQASDHLLSIRGEVGARLSTLDNAETARGNLDIELASMLSDLRDLDYAEALTRMTQQLTSLQAAQESYAKVAQLSLFNYL